MAAFFLLLACRDDDRHAAQERRIEALERRLAAVEAVGVASAVEALPTLDRDPSTGEVFPLLDEEATVACAYGAIRGMVTAQLTQDAAFDSFEADFERLRFAIDRGAGCHRYVAMRVVVVEGPRGGDVDFVATAVVTRGAGRGRQLESGKDGVVVERERMSEAEVERFTAGEGWIGVAR